MISLCLLLVLLLVVIFSADCKRSSFATLQPALSASRKPHVPYSVVLLPDVLTRAECAALRRWAAPRLERSTVHSEKPHASTSDSRTSYQTWLPKAHPIAYKLIQLASRLTGVTDMSLFEEVQIARYEPSQQYKPHYDACVDEHICANPNKIYRRATMLVYLCDSFEGGETYFPNIDYKVRPRTGHAVLFYNTDQDTGKELTDSIHAGLPVKRGIKWIANVWIKYDPNKKGKNI